MGTGEASGDRPRTIRFPRGTATVAVVLILYGAIAWLAIMVVWSHLDASREDDWSGPGPLAMGALLVGLVAWGVGRTRVVVGTDELTVVNPLRPAVRIRPDASWAADRDESWIYEVGGLMDSGVLRLKPAGGRAVKVVATVTVPRDQSDYLLLVGWLRARGVSIADELTTKGSFGV